MIGILLALALSAALVIVLVQIVRWAFETDRQSTHREDLATFKSEMDRFLRDPMHFERKGKT